MAASERRLSHGLALEHQIKGVAMTSGCLGLRFSSMATAVLLSLVATFPAHAQSAAGQRAAGQCESSAAIAGQAAGDDGARLQDAAGRRRSVPSPRDVLGHAVGERFTEAAGVVRYMEALAAASEQVRVEPYGWTVEGRPLIRVVFGRADHLDRLEEILERNRELANPETPERRAREIAAENPLIVYFSFGIHGRESASSEAAIWMAWNLARTALSVEGVLDSTIVVMDPVLNPDGRDRYVLWYRQARALRPNPSAYSWEHVEPWPGGRFNHYLFDLNRDWAWLTQPESRMRREGWSRWTPQVHVDFHEMGWTDNYLFFPAEEPINPLYSSHTLRWSHYFGEANAHAFDRRGWPYYTGEWFDFWYPSYGDTWASFLGAIGMTYEQGGSGDAGLAIDRPDGLTLTLRDRADGHRTAGEATLRAAAAARHEMLLDFAEYHRGIDAGLPDVLVVPGEDPSRAEALVAYLRTQEIRVERAGRAFRADAEAHPGFESRRDFPAGTFLVRARQPWGRLALTLLLPEIELDATYTYDASAWSLPYGYGVETHLVRRPPEAAWQPVDDIARPPLANRFLPPEVDGGLHWSSWDDDATVVTHTETPHAPGSARDGAATAIRGRAPAGAPGVAGDAALEDVAEPYAYLLPPGFASWAGLVRYLGDGGRASVLVKGFTIEGRRWPAGTIWLPRHGVHGISRRVREAGLAERAVPVQSGRVTEGRDLGTRTGLHLSLPEVAVLTGEGVSPTSFGAHWFFLEQTLGLHFDAVPLPTLARVPIDRYDVIVVPELSQRGEPYLDEGLIEEIGRWVRSGGTLVAVGAAARVLARPLAEVAVRERATSDDDDDVRLDRALRGRHDRDVDRWESQVPGAILGVDLDPDHPLAFGFAADAHADRAYVFHRGPLAFEPHESFESVALFPAGLQKVSGVIHPRNLEHLARGTWLADRQLGSGRVILFADDPLYRHFWYSAFQPYVNAILVAPAM